MAKLPQHESGERVIVTLRLHTAPLDDPFHVADVGPAVDQPRAVLALHRHRLGLRLVFWKRAGDGGKNVGRGDDAFEAAVFVDQQCHVNARAAKQLQHLEHRGALMHEQRLVHARPRIERLAGHHPFQQVLGMDDALDRIDIAVADGEARVAAAGNATANLLEVGGKVEPDDVDARRHDRADRPVGQPQHAIDHVPLGGLEDAGVGPLLDHRLDFLLGDRRLAVTGKTEDPQHRLARDAQQPHRRCSHPGQQRHRRCHPHRHRFGIGQGDPLGHEFAQDQREVGDDDNHRQERQGFGEAGNRWKRCQPAGQGLRQRRAAEGTGENADQGDADLHGGEEAAGIVGKPQRSRRAVAALLDELLQPGPPRGHECQFGHREEAVEQDQQDNDRYVEQDAHPDLTETHQGGPSAADLRTRGGW